MQRRPPPVQRQRIHRPDSMLDARDGLGGADERRAPDLTLAQQGAVRPANSIYQHMSGSLERTDAKLLACFRCEGGKVRIEGAERCFDGRG